MELGLRGRITVSHPDLEAIRNKVLRESARKNNAWIGELIKRTSRIHAGFLFEDEKVLQNLCLYISETQNKISDPGWEAFGYYLGLNPCVLKVINHNNFNKEDPTYNTFLAFVQYEDATIGKVIKALQTIGRLDVISRIKDSINELADIILQHQNNVNFNTSSEENSDYGSMQMSNERSILSSESYSDTDNSNNNSDCINVQIQQQDIIKPLVIPPAPFIFQNIKANPELTCQRIQQSLQTRDSSLSEIQTRDTDCNNINNITESSVQRKLTNHTDAPHKLESIQTSALRNVNVQKKLPNVKKRYGKIVMLTFAKDGEKYVDEICKILRSERDCFPRIGVLVLSEHIKEVTKDPHQFITGCFHQVDYICPILTDSYFNVIRRKEISSNLSDLHLDARYAQFIYALMNKYYVANGCLNDKIRCIIPDELLPKIQCNLLMSVPIFGAWVKLSEVEELATLLFKSTV